MNSRSLNQPEWTLAKDGLCVVVCANPRQAEAIGDRLAKMDTGRLVCYQNPVDMLSSMPATRVDLVVLANQTPPQNTGRMLRWINRQWHGCMTLVVGNGGGVIEQTARQNGAFFLTAPVAPDQWDAVLQGVQQNRRARLTSK